MTTPQRLIPIYASSGDLRAFLAYPMIYNLNGEWIGFVTAQRDVYSVHGDYVGRLTDDPRILRRRSSDFTKPKLTPPQAQPKIAVPSGGPLAPLMSELTFDILDVLLEDSKLMPTLDSGEFREDMD